jgi:hypothetical protein
MLIRIANQEKLVELTEYLATLPLEVTHILQGYEFPMVGELRLSDFSDVGELFVSDDNLTWEPIDEWEKKLEAKLHAKFGNPLELKGEQ